MATREPTYHTAFVALGSNLRNPLQQVKSGLAAIAELPETELADASSWYRSKAVGPGEQPDYINGVAKLHTRHSAEGLLELLQAIESRHGRERQIRWGARTLDLDIVLFGNHTVTTERLQIPHPRLRERNFVLYPLAEIDPTLTLPDGTALSALLDQSDWQGLELLQSPQTRQDSQAAKS